MQINFQVYVSRKLILSFLAFTYTIFITTLMAVVAVGQAVPPAPTLRQERFGVYFWNTLFDGIPSVNTVPMAWGRDLVAQTGSRTIRVFIGDPSTSCDPVKGPYLLDNLPRNDYPNDPSNYLTLIAQTPEYTALFNDPRFSTYLLTTYTPGASQRIVNNQLFWEDGFSNSEYNYERDRIFSLCQYLLTFNKTFILLNWEGDHPFTFNQTATSRDGFVRWIQAIASGVSSARVFTPNAKGRVYSGLEFFCKNSDGTSHGDCRTVDNLMQPSKLVIDYVAPRVQVDYLSYSSWESVSNPPASDLTTAYQNDVESFISRANNRVTPDGVQYTNRNIILGEYGFLMGSNPSAQQQAANKTKEMFKAAETAGVSYAIFWQILNNCDTPSIIPNWGLFTPTTSGTSVMLTPPGEEFGKGILSDTVWVDDSLPNGAQPTAQGGDNWNWISSSPSPVSGLFSLQSSVSAAGHQQYFENATNTLAVNSGESLYVFIFLDPQNPPQEIMLQWYSGTWEHRAYWGANLLDFGVDGTNSRRPMGQLPSTGKWVRLQVPADQVGLVGGTLTGMAFTLYGGKAAWDRAGKLTETPTCGNTVLNPEDQSITSSGGASIVSVAASGACSWQATSNASWITITSGSSGTGVGTVSYTVSANTNALTRTGTITISGHTFTVIQAGATLQFYPLAHPVRLLDTRVGATSGCDAPGAKIGGQTSRTQTAAGRTCDGLTIPSNASVLVGTATTVQSGGGTMTLYPSDVAKPSLVNTYYAANQILNTLFTVRLGASDGAFKIFVSSDTDVVVDVTGYYAPPSNGLYFHPLPKPVRLLDTRTGATACYTPGGALQAESTRTQLATTTCDGVIIPQGAQALVGNATTVSPLLNGFLTLYPADASRPFIASANFQQGINLNSPFVVGLSSSGQFNIYVSNTTDLVVDVTGYYSAQSDDANGQGLLFNPLTSPIRLHDTRVGQAACEFPGLSALGGTTYLQKTARSCTGLPATARGLVGNVANLNAAANGYLTFWPSNVAQPFIATSNYRSAIDFTRHFTIGLSTDNTMNRFAFSTTGLVIDLTGYFAP